MKVKRTLFLVLLIALFIVCLWKMNQQYDELARYPHELSEQERENVLKYLDTEGINDLVAQKIEPEQFLPYLALEGFELENTLWYDRAYHAREEDAAYIVSFINTYKERLEYDSLAELLKTYSYNVLTRFFDEGDGYQEDSVLVSDPSARFKVLREKETLYTYEPNDLETVKGVPQVKQETGKGIRLRKEVIAPLKELAAGAKEINQKTFGDMKLVSGYMSYEEQVALYEEALEKDEKEILAQMDYPGRNEVQLGYTIVLLPNEASKEKKTEEKKENTKEKEEKKDAEKEKKPSEEEQEQAIWLRENAYKYGFIVRYPKDKETKSGKPYQPYVLRYVGVEAAKYLHDQGKVLDELSAKEIAQLQ